MTQKLKMHKTETTAPPQEKYLLGCWENVGFKKLTAWMEFVTNDGELYYNADNDEISPPVYWCETPTVEAI